ncbi:alpha/beta fold hydrolase [Streptococcus sobrinus]|uniref:alpha/beta fold hydrolase n=1 Tax=Streptococcus sobrinus TaxID=1310 RepID=UPI00030C47FD|nr:alpha/beta hydrolase [Streptococcus sobrinus]
MKIIAVIVIILLAAVIFFVVRNINYDYSGEKFLKNQAPKLGIIEKQFRLDDGNVINYAEGPENGPTIILLHGQMVDWKDYRSVLPQLIKSFHVIAIDYYGHGKSSKNPDLYNIERIGTDIALLIKERIGSNIIIAGHSSGALIAAYIAAEFPENIKALILEDGPFFSTEKGRAETTFSYMDFKNIHDYFNEKQSISYFEYSLNRHPMRIFFNKDGNDNWSKIVAKPALKMFRKDPSKSPVVWYYPPELGVNRLLMLASNIQDKTGNYDLRFGDTFCAFQFFNGVHQEEMLKKIKVPTCILHVAPPKEAAPSYYNDEGILISAMDEIDARRVNNLIDGSILVEGFESMHDIHVDKPKEYIHTIVDFLKTLEK